jgi:hypothetical protein
MRVLRTILVFKLGMYAGIAVSAAFAKRAMPSRGDAESDEVALTAVFDGIELKSRAKAFRGGSMVSWFGGITVDLREAELAPDAHLSVHSLFGGIAIRVPVGWKIESNVKSLGGGVAVKALPSDDADAPTLTLDGFTVLGGIAVGAKAAEPTSES